MKKTYRDAAKRVLSILLAVIMFAGCFGSITFTQAAGETVYKPLEDQGFAVEYRSGKFYITRTKTDEAVSVNYRTLSGSAVAGVHFTAKSGTLNFGVNEDEKTITVSEIATGYISYYIDKYQVSSRTYSLEVYNDYGDRLAAGNRSISYSGYSVSSSMYDEKTLSVSSGTITVTDDGYGQAYHSVPISNFFTNTAPYNYFNAVGGVQLRMTLDLTANEKDDGYQYVQILADQTSNYDGKEKADQAKDGDPGTMSISKYMAGFGHDPGDKNTNTAKYSFPVKSAGNNCSAVDTPWNVSPYNNSLGKLYTQKFNTNCRASDGRIIIPLNVSSLGVRFDASGNNADTWYASDVKAKIEAVDSSRPTVTGAYAVEGEYKLNDILRVSVRFSEIVKVSGTTPVLKTSLGNLSFAGGSGTNVLYFEGPVTSRSGRLDFEGFANASSIKDYDGNSFTFVNGDLAYITGVLSVITYTLTYVSDYGTFIQYVKKDTDFPLPANIFNNVPEYLEFDYWTADSSVVHREAGFIYPVFSNHTLTAHWKYKKYNITFKNDNGDVLEVKQVAYNDVPEYTGETPTKAPTAEFTYTFSDWSPSLCAVTGDAEYTATYSSTRNKYDITFKNYDGTVLQESEIEYGQTPKYNGATPEKPADAQYTYTFSRWDSEIKPVTGEKVYTAVFVDSTNSYTVTFRNQDGTFIKSEVLEYGTVPVCSTPTKEPTDTEVYPFDHWTTDPTTGDNDFGAVESDVTYYAVYRTETRYYTVTFKNYNNNVLLTADYEYGQTPEYTGETPTRSSSGYYSYTFWRWDSEFAPVTCDETYKAVYYTNTAGTNSGISWSLYCDTLTISPYGGKGNMPNYSRASSSPWFSYNNQIKHLIVEDGVTSIGNFTFTDFINLEDAALPVSLTTIGKHSFKGCISLQSVNIPYGVTCIDNYAFQKCESLTSIVIPGSVEYLGTSAFNGCWNLENAAISDGVGCIEESAFSGCLSLKTITIPGSVEYIGRLAFCDCSQLDNLIIKYGIKNIRYGAFACCSSLKSIVIPDSVASIGENAFVNCSYLKNVTLPSGIETISANMFNSCSYLENITVPEGVKTIGSDAFSYCENLCEIALPSTLETIGSGAFGYCSGSLTVYYNGSRSMWNVIYDACNSSSGLSQLSLSVIYTGTTVSTQTPDCIEAELDRYFVSGDDTNRTVTVSVKTAQGCTSYGITVTYDDENDHNQTLLLTQKSENVYTFDVPAGVDVNVMVETDSVESTVLHMGENKLYLTGSDKIYTFTPDEEGWYTFKAPDEKEIYLLLTNKEQTPLFSNLYIGEDIESYVYLAAGRTYTAEMYNNDSERGSHVGSVLIEKTSQLYKISVAAENGAIDVTSVEGLPITEAPYNALVLITPYPAEGYLYDDSNNYFGEISYGNDTMSALYNSTYYDENNVCHNTDYLFHMPASPVTVSFDFLEPSIRLVADENCIGLSINYVNYTRQQLSDLYISPNTGININYIVPICYMDYDYASVIITKEDGTVFDDCLMPDGVLTVTVTTLPRDLILIEQLNTAYDVTAYTQYFKFIPSQDGLYNFSVTAGNFIVFTRDGKQLSPESGRIYQMLEGQIYAGYIVNGNGGTITVEKTGDYTAPQPLPVITVEGGSYTVDHNGIKTILTAIPAVGYRFLYWDVEYEFGVTDHYQDSKFSYNEYSEIASFSLVFERIKYDIVFANADGTVLQHTKHYYGDVPEYNGEYPAMTTNGMTYTFTGWDGEITAVTRSKTYMATYDVTLDTVLSVGDNYVILDSDFTDYTFTPAESGWYCLSVPGSMAIKVYDGETFMTQTSMTGSSLIFISLKIKPTR